MDNPNECGQENLITHKGTNEDQKRIELGKLTTDELLKSLANSACASRSFRANQSLESYLADLQQAKKVLE